MVRDEQTSPSQPRGVWKKRLEMAEGVAVSSGLIQVSVRARRLNAECVVRAVMKSPLLQQTGNLKDQI